MVAGRIDNSVRPAFCTGLSIIKYMEDASVITKIKAVPIDMAKPIFG